VHVSRRRVEPQAPAGAVRRGAARNDGGEVGNCCSTAAAVDDSEARVCPKVEDHDAPGKERISQRVPVRVAIWMSRIGLSSLVSVTWLPIFRSPEAGAPYSPTHGPIRNRSCNVLWHLSSPICP